MTKSALASCNVYLALPPGEAEVDRELIGRPLMKDEFLRLVSAVWFMVVPSDDSVTSSSAKSNLRAMPNGLLRATDSDDAKVRIHGSSPRMPERSIPTG